MTDVPAAPVAPTALVTGATGYIGRHLTSKLITSGWKVTALIRKKSDETLLKSFSVGSESKNLSIEVYDASQDETGETLEKIFNRVKPRSVYHLASLFLVEHSRSDVKALVESNILFGLRILEAIRECKNPRPQLLIAGTSWEEFSKYEASAVNLYAATKLAYWDLVRFYSSAYGIKAAELRIFDSYGPQDPRRKVVPLLLEAARSKSAPLSFSPGEQKLHFVHVEDIASSFLAAELWLRSETNPRCEVFQISSDQAISLRELVAEIEAATGETVPVRWGEREYRAREVMTPHDPYPRVPGWSPRIKLRDGLLDAFRARDAKNVD